MYRGVVHILPLCSERSSDFYREALALGHLLSAVPWSPSLRCGWLESWPLSLLLSWRNYWPLNSRVPSLVCFCFLFIYLFYCCCCFWFMDTVQVMPNAGSTGLLSGHRLLKTVFILLSKGLESFDGISMLYWKEFFNLFVSVKAYRE